MSDERALTDGIGEQSGSDRGRRSVSLLLVTILVALALLSRRIRRREQPALEPPF